MTHNHSPKSLVGRHGLTLKFNKFWGAADKCTVPRGKRKSSFRFSSIQTRPNDGKSVKWRCYGAWLNLNNFWGRMQVLLAPEHMHACFTCTGTHACSVRILMQVHASRKRLVRALVSTTLGGKGSIRKANQQELYFAHNSEKKT